MASADAFNEAREYLLKAFFSAPKPPELPKTTTKTNANHKKNKFTKKKIEEQSSHSHQKLQNKNGDEKKMTTDGFKIISEEDLADDDSDISDAFESDIEPDGEESTSEIDEPPNSNATKDDKYTDDGFKIVSSIPEDDTDVSDAFDESDVSDEEESKLSENENSQTIKSLVNIKANSFSSDKQNLISKQNLNVKSTESNVKTMSNKSTIEKKSDGNCIENSSHNNKKRKRGSKKKNTGNIKSPYAQESSACAPKKKKSKKEETNLSSEDIEIIKSRYPAHVHKIVEKLDLNWADLESKKMRDKRELAKLPQPKPIPNCQVYLKKCPGSDKVLTVYDYSEKRIAIPSSIEKPINKKENKKSKQLKTVLKDGEKALTPEEEAKIQLRREMKEQHLEELRSIKRRLNSEVISKTLDPATRTLNMLKKIEKLGGSKVKKPFVNYKLYMEQKKNEKVSEQEKKQTLLDTGMRDLVKKKRRVRRKRDANDVPGWGSLGGRFNKEGVRVIGRKDKASLDLKQ